VASWFQAQEHLKGETNWKLITIRIFFLIDEMMSLNIKKMRNLIQIISLKICRMTGNG